MANQTWNDQKFQIHWNKLEWVNKRNNIEQRYPFCVSSKKLSLNDNNKTVHWVGHSKLKYLMAASGRGNNPYFLQESEEQ